MSKLENEVCFIKENRINLKIKLLKNVIYRLETKLEKRLYYLLYFLFVIFFIY